jgi:hypothetical protein
MMYSSIISHDSIRLAFRIASLKDLDIMSCDLENANLNAPRHEKIWFEGGIECREDHGKVYIMVHSLYGLKSAGAAFHSSLAQILQDICYTSTKADPDIWLRKAVKDNRFEYYDILFVYIDDILALSHRTKDAIHQITEFQRAKAGSVKPPKIYLGANISKMQLPNGHQRMDDFSQRLC